MNRIARLLILIFLSFFFLVLVSAGGTIWGLRAQSSDALVINLAGRQRMLVQWMTRLAAAPDLGEVELAALAYAVEGFDETLRAFQNGGQAHYPAGQPVEIPAAREAHIQQQLKRVEMLWGEFRAHLEVIQSAIPTDPSFVEAQAALEAAAPELLSETDRVVLLYQESANQRVRALRWLQIAFFVSASFLLLAGGLLIRRSLLRPLDELKRSALRIGSGDLKSPVAIHGPLEIRLLAKAIDAMRTSLQASHHKLTAWNQALETRVALRTRELEALYEVSREITAHLDLEGVLQSVTTKARELLRADLAFICLLDPDERVLRLRALSGPEGTVQQTAAPAANLFVQSVLADRCTHICKEGSCGEACGIMDSRFRASHLAASLWIENRVIGALCVGSQRPGCFSEDAPQLLARLAGAAAVAIENARLYSQAERLAALEERQRIAAEMHDGLAQMIDALGLLVDQAGDQLDDGDSGAAFKTLETAHERIRLMSHEVRRSIAALQEEVLQPASLQKRLAALLDEMSAQSEPGIQWKADLIGELHLPEEDARQVLGIAQEALNNARRYAGASQICLSLEGDQGEAVLRVEDDGCGFDPHSLPADGRQHFGLKILHARAAQLGGQLQISSTPGRGTSVRLIWPLRQPGPDFAADILN